MNTKMSRMMKMAARIVLTPFLRFKKIEMRCGDYARRGLLKMMEKIDKRNLVMVEIGSYRGESAELIMSTDLVSRLYCVDPWTSYYDLNDGHFYISYTDENTGETIRKKLDYVTEP